MGVTAIKEPSERDQLRALYETYVCPGTCPVVLKMMREAELRRLVFIGMYVTEFNSRSKRGRLIARLCKVVGIGRTSGWQYAEEYDRTRVRQVQ